MNVRVAALTVSSLLLEAACARSAPAASSAVAAVSVDSAAALPPDGGCHPIGLTAAGLAQFPLVNPEWAPVVHGASPLSAPVLLHGTVTDSQVSREDFPSTHVTHDQNTGIHLDPADQGLLATGNAAEGGDLELEWETGSYPAWAWAGPGDRIVALGRWIFDCGHPDPSPGACSGAGTPCLLDSDCVAGGTCQGTVWRYRSELHPPQGTAVIRTPRGAPLPARSGEDGPVVNVSRADVYVSADGGGAGDACVVTAKDGLDALFGAPCFPLRSPLALLPPTAPPLNAADLELDLPLPAPRGRRPVIRVVPRETPSVGGATVPARLELVEVLDDPSPRVHAVVHMREPVAGAYPTGWAGTILAGWQGAPRDPFVHLRVTVDGVRVADPLKPPPPVPGLPVPAGWVMEASVNGEWQQLAGLEGVDAESAGSTIPVHAVFDQWVPRGGTLTLAASAASRTCNDLLFGQRLLDDVGRFGGSLPLAFACLADRKQLDAGSVAASFSGPRFGARTEPYLVASQGGAGAFALSFRITRVDDDD